MSISGLSIRRIISKDMKFTLCGFFYRMFLSIQKTDKIQLVKKGISILGSPSRR